jgi:hypothetical protein
MPSSCPLSPGRPAPAPIAPSVRLRTWLLPLLLAALAAAGCRPSAAGDPLAADIQHWSTILRLRAVTDRGWEQFERAARPRLESAQEALRHGRRELALARLVEVRVDIAAVAYLRGRSPDQLRTPAAFEGEWTRLAGSLRDDLGPPSPGALSGVRPAVARAMGEAALPQVREYYQASLEYGRSTLPQDGYSYLGTAQALQQLVAFCRTVSAGFPDRRQPELRVLDAELDALSSEVVAAFRPPAAIAKHDTFIGVGSLLKEARELNAAGLRYGALLRYLQAALVMQPLRPAAPVPDARILAARLHELDARLSAGGLDHSIGRLYLEMAQAHLAGGTPGASAATAAAILGDVLPRYFAALGPAPRAAPRPAPTVTVTLLRWPYT